MRFKLDDEFVRSFVMIDIDLELVLKEVGLASPPDHAVSVYSFKLVHLPTGSEMGVLNLRVGYTANIIQYRGNIGFTVIEKYRGNNYAARSCTLLIPLLRSLKFSPLWITCNVDNAPSRKSIEKIGAVFIETLSMPENYQCIEFYPIDSRKKLRFRWDII